MTITSRGAVGPTSDQVGARNGTAAAPPPLDTSALDGIVDDVADHAISWAKTDAAARAELLQRVIDDTMATQDEWLAAACATKGLSPGSTEAGEELYLGIGTFVRMARLLRDSLRDIAKDGKPAFAGPVREAPDGRLRVRVFPASAFDRITFPQTTAEIFMQPGVTRDALVAEQAAAYADPLAHAGTALVLAAGNVAALGPRDVLSKLFVEGKVVVMKANPVNDYLVPHWRRALAALLQADVLRIVDGRRRGGAVPDRARPASTRCTSRARTRPMTRSSSAPVPRGPGGSKRTSPRWTSRDGRAGQRLTRDRGAGQVVDPRAALPGRAHRHHVGEQCRLQLRLGPAGGDACRLAPARGVPRCIDADVGRDHHAPGLLPGRRRPAGCLRRGPPRRRGVRPRAGRRAALDVSSVVCPRGRRGTCASTWSRSAGRWPRRR